MQTFIDGTLIALVTAVLATMPVTAESDDDLVRQAQQDLRKFSDLYERYVQNVFRYLLVHTGSEADAEDLTSQTFMAAMENLHQYKGKRPFPAWLFGIAKNKRADFYRQRKPEADLDTAVTMIEDDEIRPDEWVHRQLQIETVTRKLAAIAPDRAEAISLRMFGGLAVPEIARMMDRQETAVRMLIHRGLRDLQKQLAPELEEQR